MFHIPYPSVQFQGSRYVMLCQKVSYTTLIIKIDKCLSVALLIAETVEQFVLFHFHNVKTVLVQICVLPHGLTFLARLTKTTPTHHTGRVQ